MIDFRNDADSVQKSFQKYYQTTILTGEVDTQRLYTLLDDIKAFKIYNDSERLRKASLGAVKTLTRSWKDVMEEVNERYNEIIERYGRF